VSIRSDEILESPESHAVRSAAVSMLGVISDMRRQGIGRDLLQYAISFAREQKVARLTLDVDERNIAAIALYENMGWIPIDRRMAYPLRPP
jgi:ribosomal-protein-alanine N-acetyltransferase